MRPCICRIGLLKGAPGMLNRAAGMTFGQRV
jgi:hypothetical protein